MNLDKIKNNIAKLVGFKLKLKVNMGRNRFETIYGYIDKLHPNIFTVKTGSSFRSFSYSDVAIKSVEVYKFD